MSASLPADWGEFEPTRKVDWLLSLEYTTQIFPEYGRAVRELQTLRTSAENLHLRILSLEGLV